ncbi:protein ANTAGONIST OF LIKE HETEROCHROMATIN PROTEIN 1-like [Chenopodium quinoa]|uniref:protein ANTAGONIST OF LIKE HETEROCHROMATIN PROTEIN 1-like n=1 Tax=Chenopodium quinoa TaxID=63459 RepID=UPI000B7993BD|nr:protein ANTAGONIST OF LIKE HETEROCHROMATIN PROTEIN 1-like [Chenopodium quinoa]
MESCRLSLLRRKRKRQTELLVTLLVIINFMILMYFVLHKIHRIRDKKRNRLINLNSLIRDSDVACRSELSMNRHTFGVLCEMISDIGGLRGTRNMSLQEIVAMFLYTSSHHKKNRSRGHYFYRSGESVSRQFNLCLLVVLKLHHHLLKKPTPITEDCEDSRWKCFQNCLGALDGTFIKVYVPNEDRGRYRTRKRNLAMNVLGVCTPNMEFVFVLPGWEGSAHDGRVLRDAISRPNGLKVSRGCYFLVDAGYTNCEGFLAPYRGHRYHLKEWGDRVPASAEEYFNMKHSKARNVIERTFGLLKGRWAILRSPSFFSTRTQGRIVTACAILHNLIRKHMPTNFEVDESSDENENEDIGDDVEYITQVQPSNAWTGFRNNLAQTLFNAWRARQNNET